MCKKEERKRKRNNTHTKNRTQNTTTTKRGIAKDTRENKDQLIGSQNKMLLLNITKLWDFWQSYN